MLKTEPTIKELIAEHSARVIENEKASKVRDELYLAHKPCEAEEEEATKAVDRMSDAEYAVLLCPVYTFNDLLLKLDFTRKWLPCFRSEPPLEELRIEELAYVVPSRDLHAIMERQRSPEFGSLLTDALLAYRGYYAAAGENKEEYSLRWDKAEKALKGAKVSKIADVAVKIQWLRTLYHDDKYPDPPEEWIEQIFSDIEQLAFVQGAEVIETNAPAVVEDLTAGPDKIMEPDPAEEQSNVKPVSIFDLLSIYQKFNDRLDELEAAPISPGSKAAIKGAYKEWNDLERAIHFHPVNSLDELAAKAKFICTSNILEANPDPEKLKLGELGYWALQRDIEDFQNRNRAGQSLPDDFLKKAAMACSVPEPESSVPSLASVLKPKYRQSKARMAS